MTGACTNSSGSLPPQCLWKQGLVCGERDCDGGAALHTSLNNGASLLWQSRLLPVAFLVVEILFQVFLFCHIDLSSEVYILVV